MQTLVQTQKMDQLEQEVPELCEEVTTLRVEVEKLTNLVFSLIVQQKPQPLGMRPPQRQHQPLRVTPRFPNLNFFCIIIRVFNLNRMSHFF